MIKALIFLPLISAILTGFANICKYKAAFITTIAVSISAAFSMVVFFNVIFLKEAYLITLLEWINIGSFKTNWAIKIDTLTAIMLSVVTIISSLVHLYSIGYMKEDPDLKRFMAYLSLFTFAMLMLVSADNLIQLFFGWEGVGVCSYLLIGFWYKKPSAQKAAMKAFIVNRVGDVAFLIGIFFIFLKFGSVNFEDIFQNIDLHKFEKINILGMDFLLFNVIAVLLFIGSMGKSAQIGLHTWLPDAMEGPTPVSALIHAATMVTAGVFLVVRFSPIFEYAPGARDLMIIIGSITCLFAATIALTQFDIKKIIAYSTCSQLGYMFFACGLSAYNGAIFHLATHAFFKALLFLCAGSVIHAMGGEQDIRKMGSLANKIKKIHLLMIVGSLALSGIWPFAGYYSKDAILTIAYVSENSLGKFAFTCGMIAAFCTAFYSWRLLIMVFYKKSNYSSEIEHHIHESPKIMLLPLYILAIGAITFGILGEEINIIDSNVRLFWQNAIFILKTNNIIEDAHKLSYFVKLSPAIVAIMGIVLAYMVYMKYPDTPSDTAKKFKRVYHILYNKYYFDEIYDKIFVENYGKLSNYFWDKIDKKIIDDLGPNRLALISQRFSHYLAKLQSGYIYNYALIMILCFVIIINWYIFRKSY